MAARVLPSDEALRFLLALGVLLGFARASGELTRRLGQPVVLGEILAGLVLGPTVLGRVAPEVTAWLFRTGGTTELLLDGLSTLAAVLFLLVAGMEVDLSAALRRRRVTVMAGTGGVVFPFALGWLLATAAPDLLGASADGDRRLFALFFATALSISALPVIARILMDLHLFRSDFGMGVIGAAVLNDLVGWTIFAFLIGQIDAAHAGLGPVSSCVLTLSFAGLVLTVGRRAFNRALPFILAHTSWPAGVVGTVVTLALLGAALTELAGVHAIFGAFLMGVALGDSRHLSEHTRSTISGFVNSVFAPIFFASIGLTLDFARFFDPLACALVLVVACAGKLIGCGLAARWAGLPRRESLAFGLAMNARGSMEIVLGMLALEAGLIGEVTFVALVVMALATTLLSGPALRRLLQPRKVMRWTDLIGPHSLLVDLAARTRREAIVELAGALDLPQGHSVDPVAESVWKRESSVPTGLEGGIAIPHARLEGLERPLVAVGLSPGGIDFDAADAGHAHVIVLLVTPRGAEPLHLELLGQIAKTLSNPDLRAKLRAARTRAELLDLLRG